jgi:phosphopantetheine--protein transferase-like protein
MLQPHSVLQPRVTGRQVTGIGTDILSLERMRRCVDSPAFVRGTFTDAEIDRGSRQTDRHIYYALVFAGKEAVFKCFGLEADALRSWRDIEIVESGETRPAVNLSGGLAAVAAARGVREVLLSLSHDTDYATAVAALVGEARRGD